jgi:hypothetical protein
MAKDIAEGTAYVSRDNFSSVEEYQQWLRAVVEHIYPLPSADWRTGAVRESAYSPHAGAQGWGVCPVGVKSYFQA